MKETRRIVSYGFLWIIFFMIMGSGCAKAPPKSGFLQNYADLHQDPEDKSLFWYERLDVDWKKYPKLMIDPVVVYLHPEAQNRQIDPEALSVLTEYFRNAVIREVQDAYLVVDKPGPDVLRIRAAITDLIPANPLINTTMVLVVGLPVDMGGASMEAEFLDAATNKPLGAVVDKKVGIPVNPEDYLVGFTKWGHAKTACDAWAELLRESLDEIHGR
jgi:hypothetical protein